MTVDRPEDIGSLPYVEPSLLARVPLARVREALEKWWWLLPDDVDPIAVTAAGDVLLRGAGGAVSLLDCGSGSLDEIAPSLQEFEARCQVPEARDDWLQVPVVQELIESGDELEPGECYGYVVLPIFKEGSYEPGNRRPVSAFEHIRFTGEVHSEIKDMPDGTPVELEWQ